MTARVASGPAVAGQPLEEQGADHRDAQCAENCWTALSRPEPLPDLVVAGDAAQDDVEQRQRRPCLIPIPPATVGTGVMSQLPFDAQPGDREGRRTVPARPGPPSGPDRCGAAGGRTSCIVIPEIAEPISAPTEGPRGKRAPWRGAEISGCSRRPTWRNKMPSSSEGAGQGAGEATAKKTPDQRYEAALTKQAGARSARWSRYGCGGDLADACGAGQDRQSTRPAAASTGETGQPSS